MAKAYQYDASGYYAGEVEDYGLLPNNATHTVPPERAGHIPRWNGLAWEQVENHKGTEGYVDGQPFTVKDYGPLPAGWSAAPPPPTFAEAVAKARAALRLKRKEVEYGGFFLDGQKWDSAEKDELRLNSALRLFAACVPQLEGWKTSEGRYLTLTPELAGRASLALMQHYSRAFALEATKLAEIEALEDADALNDWLEVGLARGWEQAEPSAEAQ